MRLVLASTFSPNMLPLKVGSLADITIERVDLETARELVELNKGALYSVVGHESTARLMSELFGIKVPVNRVTYKWKKGDIILVCTLSFRPPEGKVYTYHELKQLYEEGKIAFYVIEVLP